MKTRVSIRFWFRRNRQMQKASAASATTIPTQPDEVGTLCCRITVRREEVEITAGVPPVAYGDWSASAQAVTSGRKQYAGTINASLTKMRDQLTDIWADLERQNKPVTASAIARLYRLNGATVSMKELFGLFLQEQQSLIGVEIGKSTATAHRVRYNNLCLFLEACNLTDLRPEEFTHNMADKYNYWLMSEKGHARNTALKNLQNVSQVLTWGVRREHLDKNPMALYRFRLAAPKPLKYLTVGEVSKLRAAHLSAPLARVRDCFVFQCWTGLAYADLAGLDMATAAEYQKNGNGILLRLLRVTRQKSTMHQGYECVIPLLPEAERILSQYEDELPVPSNAVYNRFLKDIARAVDIDPEKMTSHVGRKTAGVMMLNLGIRMEVVSKFLGHASVRMTEKVYAKILDRTVVNEFDRVFGAVYGSIAAPPTAYEPETGAVQVVGRKAPRPPAPETRKARRIPRSVGGPAATQKLLQVAAQERPAPVQKRQPPADADPFGLLEMRQRWAV